MSKFKIPASLESLISLVNLLENEKKNPELSNSSNELELINQFKNENTELFSDIKKTKKTSNSQNLSILLGWLKFKDEGSLARLSYLWKTLSYTVLLAGLFLGASSAALIFNYNGKEAVNLALPLLTFVLVPVCILFFNLLFLLPGNFIQKLPLFSSLYSTFDYFSPGRVISKFLSKFVSKETFLPGDTSSILGAKSSNKIWKWVFLHLNQIFTASFFIAVLAYFIFQISIKDIAFAWGSTLEISANNIHRLTEAISFPWRSFLPEARPSLELIEQTRVYRLGEIAKTQSEAAKFGSWWYFLAVSIFSYGLLPRLLLLCFIGPYKDRLIKNSHLKIPGLSQVLSKIKEPRITIQASEGVERINACQEQPPAKSNTVYFPDYKLNSKTYLISWNFSLSEEQKNILLKDVKLKDENYINLSFENEIDAFEKKLTKTQKLLTKNSSALLLIRAWEIPLLETLNQLKDLAQNFSVDSPLQILLIDPSSKDSLELATSSQNTIWAHKISELEANIIICSSLNLKEYIASALSQEDLPDTTLSETEHD